MSRCIDEAAAAIRSRWSARPRAGLILGTGMGHVVDLVEEEAAIDYEDIPHFARSTALAHVGRLVCGNIGSVPVVAMQGRVHLYEGYSPRQVALPVHVMHALGCETLIVTNASGGLNPNYRSGDIVVLEDHINLMWKTTPDPFSGRFSGRPYCPRLIDQALAVARRENFAAHRGVYAAMTGPSYETRAEYRLLRRLGADVVGMSTVPEVLAAAARGLRVLGLSIVTNVARPDAPDKVDAEEVLHDATLAGPEVKKIIRGILT